MMVPGRNLFWFQLFGLLLGRQDLNEKIWMKKIPWMQKRILNQKKNFWMGNLFYSRTLIWLKEEFERRKRSLNQKKTFESKTFEDWRFWRAKRAFFSRLDPLFLWKTLKALGKWRCSAREARRIFGGLGPLWGRKLAKIDEKDMLIWRIIKDLFS